LCQVISTATAAAARTTLRWPRAATDYVWATATLTLVLRPYCVRPIQVLSVVAQQLLVLRHARLAAAPRIVFEGRAIFVKEHHVIVTVSCDALYSTISVLSST
jgi:hypothetical protein